MHIAAIVSQGVRAVIDAIINFSGVHDRARTDVSVILYPERIVETAVAGGSHMHPFADQAVVPDVGVRADIRIGANIAVMADDGARNDDVRADPGMRANGRIEQDCGGMNLRGGVHLRSLPVGMRSEERRVGKECRSRWSPYP